MVRGKSGHIRAFSGIKMLPRCSAPDTIVPGCIVLEGGAFRGVYGEGVLDALMEAGVNFQCTIGVSAGALNGFNYVSGQVGRAARINLTYRHDRRYVGPLALKKDKSIVGFDFAFNVEEDIEPLDKDRFYDPRRRFIAVATNCITGKPEYFEKGECSDIFQAVRASASMPYVSKMVDVDGKPCLDGGCAVKIPYRWALDQGFEKIVIVRTLPKGYRRPIKESEQKMADMFYGRSYPAFAAVQGKSSAAANRQCEEMAELEAAGKLFIISPSKTMKIGRLERDMEKLGQFYYLGYGDGKASLNALYSYLG